jgi:ABC-type proline/glycine betaine transport system permease subunit
MQQKDIIDRIIFEAMKKMIEKKLINRKRNVIPEPPKDLTYQILNRIEVHERNIAFLRIFILGIFVLCSLFGIWLLSINVISELSSSGFFAFISLLFVNYNSVIANFSDFFYSVIESIPAIDIAFLLFTIVFFMWSSKNLMEQFLKGSRKKQIFT